MKHYHKFRDIVLSSVYYLKSLYCIPNTITAKIRKIIQAELPAMASIIAPAPKIAGKPFPIALMFIPMILINIVISI